LSFETLLDSVNRGPDLAQGHILIGRRHIDGDLIGDTLLGELRRRRRGRHELSCGDRRLIGKSVADSAGVETQLTFGLVPKLVERFHRSHTVSFEIYDADQLTVRIIDLRVFYSFQQVYDARDHGATVSVNEFKRLLDRVGLR